MITRIGKYEIRAELGHDAFARTFQAFDPDAVRPVTVMVLTEVTDKQRLTLFRSDAAIAANLHHRNIAAIYELGEHVGLPFIAMQHLQGQDLRQVIDTGTPLTLLQKMLLMFEVAEALQAAHRDGILHVGIRPAGIVLLDDRSVKITEFGAVRLARPAANGSAEPESSDGSAFYLSPEEVVSSDPPDLLSDIFVYGAIYYELLTGKHPFAAADPQEAARRITGEDPTPLRTLAPDCPEAVEQIVQRALQKERALRYQSLEDAQLDAQPVLQELKRERSAALLIQGRGLLKEGQLDTAQTVVREALELDPGNREARRLRDTIRDQVQQRAIRTRLEMLMQQADGEMAARRFAEAVQTLESALRVDAADAAIQARLDRARALLEQGQRAAALLAEARRLLEEQDLDEARRNASETLKCDPQCHEARALLETIEEAIERRQQEAQFEEELSKVKGLVLLESFEQAIFILEALNVRRPGTPQVAHWLAHVQAQKSEKERRDRLQAGLAEARGLLENQQLQEAIGQLSFLSAEFPEEQEVRDLRAEARRRLRIQERAEAIEAVRAEAQALREARDFAIAIRILKLGLQNFPEEAELQRALDDTVAAAASYEREQRIVRVREQCTRYREEGQFDEALEVVYSSLATHPDDPALLELRGRLEREREDRQRAAAVRQALDEAQWFMEQDRPDLAVHLLRQSSAAYPEEASLAGRLAHAEQAVSEWERRRSIQETLDRVAVLEQRQQWRTAVTVLQEALRAHPGVAELTDATEHLQARIRDAERERKLARRLEIIGQKMADRAWMQALLLIEDAQKEFPGEAELERMLGRARAEQERVECENLVTGIKRCLADEDLEQAGDLLRRGIQSHPGETRLQALQQEFEDEKAYQDQSRVAEVLFGRGQFREAEKILLGLADRKPDNSDVQALLEAVRAGRAAAEEKQFYDRGRDKALRLIDEQQVDQAVDLLRNLLSVFPGDPILERDLQSALAIQGQNGDGGGNLAVISEEETASAHEGEASPLRIVEAVPLLVRETALAQVAEAAPTPAAESGAALAKHAPAAVTETASATVAKAASAPAAETAASLMAVRRGDAQPRPSTGLAARAAERQQLSATTPQPTPPASEPLQVVVTSWRRPAILTILVFFLLTATTVPLWRSSRKQRSLASRSPAVAEAAVPRVSEGPAPAASPISPTASSTEETDPATPPTEAGQATAGDTRKTAVTRPGRRRPVEAFTGWRASMTQHDSSPVPPPPPARIEEAASIPLGLPGAIAGLAASAPTTPSAVAIADPGPGPARTEALRTGGDFQQPRLLSGPQILIPAQARDRGIYGVVKLEATISKAGTVTRVATLSGHPLLVEAARQAILARRYQPATLNGKPLEIKLPIQIFFEPGR